MSIGDRMNDFEPVASDSPCNTCARRLSPFKCEAFDDIPNVFIEGNNDHREPYSGDGGLQYQAETNEFNFEEFRRGWVSSSLMDGDPGPLIQFMREESLLEDRALDLFAEVLRGKKLRRPGNRKSDPNRNTNLLFHVALYAKEGFPLTHPKFARNTAFHKAAAAMGNKPGPERAKRLWDECTDTIRDYYRRAVRD